MESSPHSPAINASAPPVARQLQWITLNIEAPNVIDRAPWLGEEAWTRNHQMLTSLVEQQPLHYP